MANPLLSIHDLHVLFFTDKGEVEALNKGVERASGDLICWLNADDWLEPKTFKL